MSDDAIGWGCVSLPYVLGMCIAVAISWEASHSVLWASVDGVLSWAFIVYHYFFS